MKPQRLRPQPPRKLVSKQFHRNFCLHIRKIGRFKRPFFLPSCEWIRPQHRLLLRCHPEGVNRQLACDSDEGCMLLSVDRISLASVCKSFANTPYCSCWQESWVSDASFTRRTISASIDSRRDSSACVVASSASMLNKELCGTAAIVITTSSRLPISPA